MLQMCCTHYMHSRTALLMTWPAGTPSFMLKRGFTVSIKAVSHDLIWAVTPLAVT